MFEFFRRKKTPSLEQQIANLAACGVKHDPAVTVEDVEREWPASAEDVPYEKVIMTLANERAENLWFFDAECIEDHGAYVEIATRMGMLAGGDLPLVDVEDFVDIEAKEAWLAFTLDGVRQRWVCEVDCDWVDHKVFTRFAELLDKRRTGRRFTYLTFGGQCCVIGCFGEAELKKLCRVTGLEWTWLT